MTIEIDVTCELPISESFAIPEWARNVRTSNFGILCNSRMGPGVERRHLKANNTQPLSSYYNVLLPLKKKTTPTHHTLFFILT